MKRKIIEIDEQKCDGCGDCIPACPEGAIQLIDGKARLISDLCCDGLGACLGHCPQGAITIEEREAVPYDERLVMANIVRQGTNVIRAHLDHLREHGADEYLAQAIAVLEENRLANPLQQENQPMPQAEPVTLHASHPTPHASRSTPNAHEGCPGARSMNFASAPAATPANGDNNSHRPSQLTHWPVQLHLISPAAPQYRGKDVLLAADCVAYAVADFHKDHLAGKSLAIACPKLDDGQETYVAKLRALIDDAKINTLTVMIMQVPCCMGLLNLARTAAAQASRKVPVKSVVVSLKGEVLQEEWV
ncbi:MAG: 4Fe-4S binding protein [Verrucomicrobia bacterium]|nr:4Fe-4S binding protein [Verrucomicrobiota bacterium]